MAVHIQLDTSSKYGECGVGMALGGGTADSDLQEGKYCNKVEFYNPGSDEWTNKAFLPVNKITIKQRGQPQYFLMLHSSSF